MPDSVASQPSLVRGIPLEEESGIGALTIAGYLRDVTSRYTEREALVMHTADGATRWSYRELWEQSVSVAKALTAAGVNSDSRVGILMTNRPEYIAALFGTALAGGVAVVFSTFSTPPELQQLLKLSDVSVLLFEHSVLKTNFAALLATLEPKLLSAVRGRLHSREFPFLQRLVCLPAVTGSAVTDAIDIACFEPWSDFFSHGEVISDAVIDARAAARSPCDAGGVFFSSGTTSLPKGILHSQRAFALQWWRYPRLSNVSEAVRCWTANGLFWSGNVTLAIGLTFTNGGTLVLQAYFEPEETLRLIAKERISFLHGREHQWARLQESASWQSTDFSSLRYVTRGEIFKQCAGFNSDWSMPMGYGNTETLSICTSNAFNRSPDAAAQSGSDGSFGSPLSGSILKIVDEQTGATLPRGSIGEICIKGPTLMMAYLGKASEETFDEDGFFRTGDGGYVDTNGVLYWQGRITDIIKTGGANVSPVEIDQALVLYPGVRRAQTVGMPHATLGEVIVACIVPHDGVTLEVAAMANFLKQRLASYKVPKQFFFFREDELEITGTGKVKVAQLRELVGSRCGPTSA